MSDANALRAELALDLDMLRAKGVQKYTDGKLTIEFFPAPPPDVKEPEQKQTERCKCGHMPYEHEKGLCLLGCDPTKCAAEVA